MTGAEAKMPPVYTVSEVVAALKDCVERRFPTVDIEAEISNWRVYPSGHAYFVLKDSASQLSAVLFARINCDCRDRLGDGRRVKVRARASVYPQRGEFQLVVTRIKIAGEGELMARYLELKAKLASEGLFSPARKRPLPRFPRRIGIVTSPAGAVIHDMFRVISRRFANIEITLYPALVQGDEAPASLIAGLDYFASRGEVDLVIIARGGGSFEDLFCFNDEALVRKLATLPMPVVSAVGHETDYTLCDFAADVRAGTPSIAAEISTPLLADILKGLDEVSRRLVEALLQRGDGSAQRLDRASGDMAMAMKEKLFSARERLSKASQAISAHLKAFLRETVQRLGRLEEKLSSSIQLAVERKSSRLEKVQDGLKMLSPFAVLDRGYTITSDSSGRVLDSMEKVSPGEVVSTRFSWGRVESRVSSVRGLQAAL